MGVDISDPITMVHVRLHLVVVRNGGNGPERALLPFDVLLAFLNQT